MVENYQVDEAEGVLPQDVAQTVQEDFWAKYDDLRWAFFREAV
jgi:U3 small nucleolar RNA-associated protein 19